MRTRWRAQTSSKHRCSSKHRKQPTLWRLPERELFDPTDISIMVAGYLKWSLLNMGSHSGIISPFQRTVTGGIALKSTSFRTCRNLDQHPILSMSFSLPFSTTCNRHTLAFLARPPPSATCLDRLVAPQQLISTWFGGQQRANLLYFVMPLPN